MTNPYTFTDNPTLSGISICDTDVLNDDIMYLKWENDSNSKKHALKSYLDDGTLLTDSEGLSDVKEYAHSSFDLSKFTVVGSPNITSDGIASGFSSSNYLKVNNITFGNEYVIKGEADISGTGAFLSIISSSNQDLSFYCNGYNNIEVFNSINYEPVTLSNPSVISHIKYKLSVDITNNNYVFEYEFNKSGVVQTTNLDTTQIETILNDISYIALGNSGVVWTSQWALNGSINLKEVNVTVDGAEVFSGHKTGIDTYTIGGSTVTIPYTLSKTGSKIVDSAYRTEVSAVYEQEGYAPYYTLSDSDFTLPQGELYGMYEKYRQQTLDDMMPDYANGINITSYINDTYTSPANGYIFIQGNSLTITINNETWEVGDGGEGSRWNTSIFPVNANTACAISASTTGNKIIFYPLKGAN